MRLPGSDDDKNRMSPHLLTALVSAGVVILLILAVVIGSNRKPSASGSGAGSAQSSSPGASGEETVTARPSDQGPVPAEEVEVGDLHPSDLDFWDLYPNLNQEQTLDTVPLEQVKPDAIPMEENDPSKDGKHTLVILPDGSEEWVVLSQQIPRNDYDYTNLTAQGDFMTYYVDGHKASYLGVDVSESQEYIDFASVKKAGIDFCMIRAGIRGYSTGTLSVDKYFEDNLKRANEAGLSVGLYFTSQALTEEEAKEEAQLILDRIGELRVDYPIVIDMGYVENDSARIEGLTREEKTKVTKAFLDTVKEAGYHGMIKGTKEWLIKEIDLTQLTSADIWLDQHQDLPDYPYAFTMWQYKVSGKVDGISGYVGLNLCFIDYTAK